MTFGRTRTGICGSPVSAWYLGTFQDHDILLGKTLEVGSGGAILQWYFSFLQVISSRGEVEHEALACRVPQGLIWSPLLFSIYPRLPIVPGNKKSFIATVGCPCPTSSEAMGKYAHNISTWTVMESSVVVHFYVWWCFQGFLFLDGVVFFANAESKHHSLFSSSLFCFILLSQTCWMVHFGAVQALFIIEMGLRFLFLFSSETEKLLTRI